MIADVRPERGAEAELSSVVQPVLITQEGARRPLLPRDCRRKRRLLLRVRGTLPVSIARGLVSGFGMGVGLRRMLVAGAVVTLSVMLCSRAMRLRRGLVMFGGFGVGFLRHLALLSCRFVR